MGAGLGTGYNYWRHPDVNPQPNSTPKFEPNYGFAEEREKKVMPLSDAEIESAKIPHHFRDYCVDKYLAFQVCRADNFPFVAKCEHEMHDYHTCEYHEYIDQMKDYERERRLMVRAKRIAEKAGAA